MITLDVQCPDHLKSTFDDLKFLKVLNDVDNTARDVLLVWAFSSSNSVWLSDNPIEAELALKERFAMFPRLNFSHVLFTKPSELTRTTFQKCVIECEDFDLSKLNTSQVRVLEPCSLAASLDSLGLSINDRRNLLIETRLGSDIQYDEDELIASICRENYYDFVQEFWGEIIQETPVWNWHIELMCDELQIISERVFKNLPKLYDLIFNMPPGQSKSTICSVMHSPWTWTRMPSARTLGGSYSGSLAGNLARLNRKLVRSDKYKRVFPEIQLAKDQQAKTHFENTKGGSRFSFGMDGTVMGFHSHFISVDDPLNPREAVSEIKLNKANSVMSETLFTRKVDKALTPTVLIMQRLHQNDCTQHMLDNYESVRHICLPDKVENDVKPEELKEKYIDGFLDPIRLSENVLKSNRKTLGTFAYAGQFEQRPVPRGGAMFKPGRIVVDVRPGPNYFQRIIRYWDKAGTQGAGCFTAGCLMGLHKNGSIWVLDVVRGQWAMDERELTIKNTAKIDGHGPVVWIEQEPGSGGKDQATYTVKNLIGFSIKVDKVGSGDGNKIARAGPFADQVNSCNVFMVKANWNKEYIDELTYFPASKYKDQVDASSGAFNKLSEGEISVGGL